MTRVVLCLAVSLVGTGAVRVQADEIITLPFDPPVEDTIKDKDGNPTGFTHRVPGWGTLIPENDPNLDLSANPGYLTITTNQASAFEWPANLEALGVLVPNVGQRDFTVSGKFHDIQFQTTGQSDQLMLYVAASASKYMQMGYHKDYGPGHGPTVSQYAGNSYDLPAVVPRFQKTPADWETGDDGIITLSRTNGLWTFSWSDLTNGDSGTSPTFEVPELWDQEDLHFGILYATVYNNDPRTSQIDEFSVTVVPEPSTLALLSMGALGITVGWWQRRRAA